MNRSVLPWLSACVSLVASVVPAAAVEEINASGPQGVSITVYNQDLGLVRETRNVELKPGINFIRVEDVAARIDPTSVSFRSLTAPNSVEVREQNYQYDLLDPNTILSKSVGKHVKFRQMENGTVREISGTLLNAPRVTVSDSNGNTSEHFQGLVIKTDNGVVLNPTGEVELAELPAGLISKPSLLWKLEANKGGTHSSEIAYQTSGMNWKADYVTILNKDDNQLDLNSWVTIDNKSGAGFHNAALKLIAGDVHRVTPPANRGYYAAPMATRAAAAPQFQEQSFAEYHLYTLQGKTDVLNNETKQLSLFNVDNVPAKKVYVFDPSGGNAWYGGYIPAPTNPQKINVKIEIDNTQKNNLGIPMPKGKVRVYKRDTEGALQFIGEDQIDHTPKDEKLRVYIGDAFDIVGEQKQMSQQNIGDRVQHASYEVSLRNHKDTAVTITVVEHAYGDWTILNSSLPYTKKDSHTFEFSVPVTSNKETKLTYEIETRW
jgi:hypothetical protein